ncbi:MAG: hypothetical protein IE931_10705 [Sphingobacteriales bacterium]|nr:hypothetical protein [Sphingobacteriales bacterium]
MNKQILLALLVSIFGFLSCKKNSATNSTANTTCSLNKVTGSYNGDNNFEQTYLYNTASLLSEMKTKDYDWLLSYNANKQLIKMVFSSPQEGKTFDLSWNQNQVTEITQTTTYNGMTSYRTYQPIYKNNKVLKYLNYIGNNSNNTILEGYDSLAYDLVGNITKLYHFTTLGGSTSESLTNISYDNQTFCDFSYEINPFEPFLLFINQTPNNPVQAKTTGSSTWSGFNLTYQYDSNMKPVTISGTYQDQPLTLSLTYNCK